MSEQFPVPKLVVSRCLGFDYCRYDGQRVDDHFVDVLRDYVEFIDVCPEYDIGLGVPRMPVRIIEKNGEFNVVQPGESKNITGDMRDYSESFS